MFVYKDIQTTLDFIYQGRNARRAHSEAHQHTERDISYHNDRVTTPPVRQRHRSVPLIWIIYFNLFFVLLLFFYYLLVSRVNKYNIWDLTLVDFFIFFAPPHRLRLVTLLLPHPSFSLLPLVSCLVLPLVSPRLASHLPLFSCISSLVSCVLIL